MYHVHKKNQEHNTSDCSYYVDKAAKKEVLLT